MKSMGTKKQSIETNEDAPDQWKELGLQPKWHQN